MIFVLFSMFSKNKLIIGKIEWMFIKIKPA